MSMFCFPVLLLFLFEGFYFAAWTEVDSCKREIGGGWQNNWKMMDGIWGSRGDIDGLISRILANQDGVEVVPTTSQPPISNATTNVEYFGRLSKS